MKYPEASCLVFDKLKEKYPGIERLNHGFKLGGIIISLFTTTTYYYKESDYQKVNISLEVRKPGTYKSLRRGLKNFDVVTGNYTVLFAKVEELQGMFSSQQSEENLRIVQDQEKWHKIYEPFKPYGFVCVSIDDWKSACIRLTVGSVEVSVRNYRDKQTLVIDGEIDVTKTAQLVQFLHSLERIV